MSNKYDNIDFCLDILFNFIYSESNHDCHYFKYIDINNIELIDIKKLDNFDYSDVFNKLKYIGKDTTRFIFKRSGDPHSCLVCVGVYDNSNENYNDMKRGEVVDMKIMYILSELVHRERLNHILLPIMNFDISYNKFKKEVNEDIIKVFDKDIKDDMLHIQVVEGFKKAYILRDYLDNHEMTLNDWKILCFQVIYTLFIIQKKFPSFRHNQLNLDNIFVYKNENSI